MHNYINHAKTATHGGRSAKWKYLIKIKKLKIFYQIEKMDFRFEENECEFLP